VKEKQILTNNNFVLQMFQGALIGLGAVLPGVSGGVLSVIFGIYKPIMELLANPFRNFKTHVPKLIPYIIGVMIGFLGIAKLLAFVLERYPAPSVCLFVGLIGGMLPSLWREAGEQGRNKMSVWSMLTAMVVIFALLIGLKSASVSLTPGFTWYLFCGFCLALSLIAPGMSFSTLLMPLGLYTPFVDGIGNLSMGVLLPGGIGALLTVVCLSKGVNYLFDCHYSVSFHAIVGIVIAATVMIIPYDSFFTSWMSWMINVVCLAVGIFAALMLDRFNGKIEKK
jgi:putative membrane protein